jgi:membrane protease YdiL (CAAX protease family)
VIDVVAAAVLYVVGSGAVGQLLKRLLAVPDVELSQLPPDQQLLFIFSLSVGSLAGVGLVIAWLRLAVRATWAEMGWRGEQWRRQVMLGLASFLVLILPIFGMQALLNYLYERIYGPPPQHPLIEHLLEHPGGVAFLIAGFTAVVVAPLTEEFLIRGVLQGWLERLAIHLRRFLHPPLAEQEADGGPMTATSARPLLVWPILVSSLLFALMHYEHGVAWVPLFFFALGLGYLYQRTRSLIAPIVLHVSLNATTMLILWLATLAERGALAP